MAPKNNPPAAKQALILAWMRNSCVAHNIKDLEKALPSVASINGMQVKDYLQALSDDNKIHVEKIGSGNWYWSFPSEEKKTQEAELEKVQAEHDKAEATANELQAKVDEAEEAREDDADDGGMGRGDLLKKKEELEKEVEVLRKELMSYSQNDPVEIDKKRERIEQLKRSADAITDHILSMEGWLKEQIGDPEQLMQIKRQYYGDEFDEENEALRDL